MLANEAQPVVSVVIPVKNGAATLGAQLEALANQRCAPAFQVVVSDNGSEDDLHGVLAQATRRSPHLHVVSVDSSDRRGVPHARNVGASGVNTPFILFCDSDDIVCADWVRALADGLQNFDGVGGPLDERGLNSPNSPAHSHANTSFPVGLRFLPYPIGANCGVRREVWQKLGGFDERYTIGAEEVDFYWRLQLAGHTLGFIPHAVISYRHRIGLVNNARHAFGRGISSCHLAAQFKAVIPRESAWAIVRAWGGTLSRVPLLAFPSTRLRELRRLAHQVGQIVGSFRYGVVHLAD
jgi:GT2 family glycosyltransferase